MDSTLRTSAFAGLGAFALSILVALFSRVPFGALILRALLSGLVFGALVYGAIMLLRRFLPELFEEPRASRPEEPAAGGLVDIVLPGGEAQETLSELPGVPETPPASLSSRSAQPEAPRAAAPRPAPGPSQSRPPAPMPAQAAPEPFGEEDELAKEVADLRSGALLAEDGGAETVRAPRPSVALEELDTLPDLDGFSDSFALGAGVGESVDESQYIGPASSMPSASSPGGADPAALAKAVQTILRKDQKGQI